MTLLFAEFPARVVGEPSAFAAHLTRLRDHVAIDAGTVVVTLSGGEYPAEVFSVARAARPGIFRPVVRPAHAGARQVSLRLDSAAATEAHAMGELMVYPSRARADHAQQMAEHAASEGGPISYLLEQQWQVPFAVRRAETRQLRPNFPAFARLVLASVSKSSVTAPREGRVAAVHDTFPVIGQVFAAGAALFEIDSAPQDGADRATLELAVDQAKIGVASAKRDVDRLTPLALEGVVAQRRLDDATSALAQARAKQRSARKRRDNLWHSQQITGSRHGFPVRSPIGGAISELLVAPGAWVSKDQRLARVVDRDRLWLDVRVPETYVGRLRSVSGAWFRLDGYPDVFEAARSALVSVDTEVDPKTRTLAVRFAIDNTRRTLFAGMTAQAHLVSDASVTGVAVPASAVLGDGGVQVVYVQLGGETFARRPVRLGGRDGNHVQILSGVSAGEWVVSEGAYLVKLASTSTESIGHGHAH